MTILTLLVVLARGLKSLSIAQGFKYDDLEPAFIELHGLAVVEILDPLDSFSTLGVYHESSHIFNL